MKATYLFIPVLLFYSCRASEKSNSDMITSISVGSEPDQAASGISAPTEAAIPYAESETKQTIEEIPIQIQPQLIKEAHITLKVASYKNTKMSLASVINQFNAMITHENETRNNYQIENQYIIRVPAVYFDTLTNTLEILGIRTDQRSVNVQDISEDFIDITARLKTKNEYELKYFELLRKTTKVSDIIPIQNELKILREEIESLEGRLNYLKNRTALCTVHLRIYESLDYSYQSIDNGIIYRIKESLATGWNGVQTIVLGFICIWPLWFIFGFAYIIIRFFYKKKKKNIPHS